MGVGRKFFKGGKLAKTFCYFSRGGQNPGFEGLNGQNTNIFSVSMVKIGKFQIPGGATAAPCPPLPTPMTPSSFQKTSLSSQQDLYRLLSNTSSQCRSFTKTSLEFSSPQFDVDFQHSAVICWSFCFTCVSVLTKWRLFCSRCASTSEDAVRLF